MAKPTKDNVFKPEVPKPETAMDKTTRVVMKMIDDDAEKRQIKTAKLRKARLEREAVEQEPAPKKKRATKAATKK